MISGASEVRNEEPDLATRGHLHPDNYYPALQKYFRPEGVATRSGPNMISSSRARQAGSTTYLSSRRTTVYTHPPLELAATIFCQYIYSLKYYCHLEWRTRPLKSKASTSDFPDLTPIAIVVDEPPWVLLSITLWVSTTRSIGTQNQGGYFMRFQIGPDAAAL